MDLQKSLLPTVWDVPQVFRDRLGEGPGRQRAMQGDGHLLLVLHAPPGPTDADRLGRFFWRRPDGTWSSDALGSGPAALRRHLDEYANQIARFEQQDNAAQTADEYFDVVYNVSPLRRASRNMHRVLQDARKMCSEDRNLISLRDRAYQIERMAELLYSDAKNGLDLSVARRAEEQTRSSHRMAVAAHRLNLLVAFFFPIATLTAIFGVNLTHGLEKQYAPVPFLACLGIGLFSGLLLKSAVNRDPPDIDG